jgi:hypothetical protein
VPQTELILLDPPMSPHPPLQRGQRFLICGLYPDALGEFLNVFRAAAANRDYVLQADAAARMAWANFEMDHFRDALNWASLGIRLIETHLGARLNVIIKSVQPASRSAVCAVNDAASHVLCRLLSIRAKTFAERIVHHQDLQWRVEAERSYAQSLALDEYLRVPEQLGHDLRWKAVLTAGLEPLRKEADDLLSASREKFAAGSLGEAYLARDRGVVCWQADRCADARYSLLEAADGLSSFADSRALAPTFRVLSRVILQSCGDSRRPVDTPWRPAPCTPTAWP